MQKVYPGPRIGGAAIYDGFTLGEVLRYTTIGTHDFERARWPGLRALIVECQGAGGGAPSIATATASDEAMLTSGASGGGYAQSLVLATDLEEVELITVPAGGNGVNGGDAIFDTLTGEVRGKGGLAAIASGIISASSLGNLGSPQGATGNVGDFVIKGGAGHPGLVVNVARPRPGRGGDSALGMGGQSPVISGTPSGVGQGVAGSPYGGGAGGNGKANAQSATATGTVIGGQAIVIVTVLY